MKLTSNVSIPKSIRALALIGLAVAVAFSWLGLVAFTDAVGFSGSVGAGAAGNASAVTADSETMVSAETVRESLKRTNYGGASTTVLTAVWATETYFAATDAEPEDVDVSPDDHHVFVIFLDTHTGSLAEVDWANESTLIVDGESYEPVRGQMISGGYHHGMAAVEFPKTVDGEPVMTGNTENVTLRVVGLESVERDIPDDRPRTVSWTYPPPYDGLPPEQIYEGDCNCTTTATETLNSPDPAVGGA